MIFALREAEDVSIRFLGFKDDNRVAMQQMVICEKAPTL